jgi:hypothetical protein
MICIQNNNSTNIKINHEVKWLSVYKTTMVQTKRFYFFFYLYVCTIVVLYTDRHFTSCFIFMFVLLLFCIQIVTLLHVLSLCLYYCCFVYRSSLYSMFYLYVCTIVVLYTDRHFTPCFILCLYYFCFVYRTSLYSMFYLYVCTVVVLCTDHHFDLYTKQQWYKHKDKSWSKVTICIQNNNSTNKKIKHGVKWWSV